MSRDRPYLSKSKYMLGLQCPMLLWVHYNDRQRLPDTGAATEFRFAQGHEVGEWAKRLYPEGIDIDWGEGIPVDQVVAQSQRALEQRRPVFEAGFMHRDAYARADLLVPAGRNSWDLIEVKSTTKVKDEHIADVAFQRWVYGGAGVPIRGCFVMVLNRDYVRDGEVDPAALLVRQEVTDQIVPLMEQVEPAVHEMHRIIGKRTCPVMEPVTECSQLLDCDLAGECWSFLPERNVLSLYYGRDRPGQLMQQGVFGLTDIPVDFSLTEKQRIQVACARSGRPYVNVEGICAFVEQLAHPLYYLDFETFNTAVPMLDRSGPYEKIPFQYSLHVQHDPGGDLEHFEFLADGIDDPRPHILSRLRDELGTVGSIVAYNQSFEVNCLRTCAGRFPEHADWVETVIPRFVDLIVPFRSFDFYHPDQGGSAGLKHTMPALTGMGYNKLAISDGETASLRFLMLLQGALDEDVREAIRRDLRAYCGQDTEGMVEMVRELRRLAG